MITVLAWNEIACYIIFEDRLWKWPQIDGEDICSIYPGEEASNLKVVPGEVESMGSGISRVFWN